MQTLGNFFSVANMIVPSEGPKVVPILLDFIAVTEIDIDGNQIIATGQMQYIQTVYIDNSGNDEPISIISDLTDQVITCPPNSQGNFNVFMPNNPKFRISTDGGVLVKIFFCNFPLIPCVWSTQDGSGVVAHVIVDSIDSPVEVMGPGGDPVEVEFGSPQAVNATIIEPVNVNVVELDRNIIAETQVALDGTDQTLPLNGTHWFFIINNGANPIFLNLAGGDATASGIEIPVDGSFEYTLNRYIDNDVHVSGTNGQTALLYAATPTP